MSGMQMTPVSVEINSDTIGHRIAHINEDGHIILSGDDLGGSQGLWTKLFSKAISVKIVPVYNIIMVKTFFQSLYMYIIFL